MQLNLMLVCAFIATAMLADGLAVEKPLRVVTTLPDYAVIARDIGGSRIMAEAIVRGEQDAHYIRPKPSFVTMVRQADVLVDTGLDLEMWLPTVVDKSGNTKIRGGQPGYVAVSKGLNLLEKPKTFSRSEGGVHIYGNPHITSGPVNMRTVARNIAAGLIKNDPAGKGYYQEHAEQFVRALDERMFGKTLVDMCGGDTLSELAAKGALYSFLEKQTIENRPLIEHIGGWAKQMLPMRNKPIVTYHKNWVYFFTVFDLVEAGTVEPKPGIPPSPNHVLALTEKMRSQGIKILLAANYFDEQQVRMVAERAGAEAVIVPLYVGGAPGTDTYFGLVDLWVSSLLKAAGNNGMIK